MKVTVSNAQKEADDLKRAREEEDTIAERGGKRQKGEGDDAVMDEDDDSEFHASPADQVDRWLTRLSDAPARSTWTEPSGIDDVTSLDRRSKCMLDVEHPRPVSADRGGERRPVWAARPGAPCLYPFLCPCYSHCTNFHLASAVSLRNIAVERRIALVSGFVTLGRRARGRGPHRDSISLSRRPLTLTCQPAHPRPSCPYVFNVSCGSER